MMRVLKKFRHIPSSGCEDNFDCEAALDGFAISGLVDGMMVCGETHTIEVPWIGCDGERAEDPTGFVLPLTANGVTVPFVSQGAGGLSNIYSYEAPDTGASVPFDVVFEFGLPTADSDSCSYTARIGPCGNDCEGNFDCETSENGFQINGLVNGMMVCGETHSIEVPWVDCEGNRANDPTGLVLPLTANGSPVTFVAQGGAGNVTNIYEYMAPVTNSAVPVDVVFEYGLPSDPSDSCSVTFQIGPCESDLEFPPLKTGAMPSDPDPDDPVPPQGGTVQQVIGATTYDVIRVGNTHDYATRPAFNADETLTFDTSFVYDLLGNVVAGASPFNSEAVWAYTQPNIIYGIHSASQNFGSWNINTQAGTYTPIGNVGSLYTNVSIGRAEGSMSENDSCVALVGDRINGSTEIFTLDVNTGAIIGRASIAGLPGFDNVKISKDGRYVVAELQGQGLMRWDKDMTNPTLLETDDRFHFDTATDVNGRQVAVGYSQGSGMSFLHSHDIETGKVTVYQFPNAMGGVHVSATNTQRKGYVYVTPIGLGGAGKPSVAVKLNASNNVIGQNSEGYDICAATMEYECWGYAKQNKNDPGPLGEGPYDEQAHGSASNSGSMIFKDSGYCDQLSSGEGFIFSVA